MQLTTLFCILMLFPTIALTQNVKTYIPKNAQKYLPIMVEEVNRILPNFPYPHYFGGLAEHESCISLTHSRCWSPTSRLKTSREEGAGIPQLTRAFHPNGKLRFDTLSDLRRQHKQELSELSWNNVYQRPDLQIRAMILLSKSNYDRLYEITDPIERVAMADSAYNGGLGNVNKGRRMCGLKAGCDPQLWFGHVEYIPARSTRPLYAGRSAQDINRHHVRDVILTRMPKYKPYFDTDEGVEDTNS